MIQLETTNPGTLYKYLTMEPGYIMLPRTWPLMVQLYGPLRP